MSKGYIMIATGEEHIQQAYLCAKSIKQTQNIKKLFQHQKMNPKIMIRVLTMLTLKISKS